MAIKKYATLNTLSNFLDNLKNLFATKTEMNTKANASHSHAISDITNLQTALDTKTNQNAFSNVKIDNTTISADITTDTLTIVAGNNITITPDATNDRITISSTDTNTTYSAGTGISLSGTTFSNSGVRSVSTGSSNGTISVNTNGTTTNVAVKGLGSAAYTASTAYDAAGAANNALTSAKTYADNVANAIKNDLLNGAGEAYNTLKELGDLIDDNTDAIDALEVVAAGKADKSHTHSIANVSGLQSALDGKASSSHGTHVTYSTTAPVMDGTASVGSANAVARSDHRHPTDTSRAAQTSLDSHTSNTTVHTTSTERTNWNAAKTHADSSHAPSNAEKNQNAFSNVKVGTTTVAADTATDTITFEGSNVTITPDATNDKITFAVANGSTSAKGVVQLTNSTSSTSTTTAATPSSVKSAYDLANQAKTAATNAQTTADGKANASHTHTVANITDLTATAKELNYMDGVTSNVQTQLDGKAASSHNHSAANITSGTLSNDRLSTIPIAKGGTGATTATGALTNLGITATAAELNIMDGVTATASEINKLDGLTATTTELNYVDGVTSNIQTQLNDKAKVTYKSYSAFGTASTGSDGWYTLFTLNDSTTGSVLCLLKGYAHSSVVFTATKGYAANATLNVLDYNSSSNGSYAYVKALRILSDGKVQAQINTGTVNISIHIVSANGTLAPVSSLVCDTSTSPEVCVSRTLSAGKIIANGFVGDLSGNASSATKATQDGSGNTITSTYATKSELDTAKSALQTSINNKANSSHTHTIANITNLQTTLDGKAASSHTHSYAGSSSAGGAATSANKVNSSLTVKLNGGTTEGTNLFTFNGSAGKNINITHSAIGAAASSHTHDDRYYTETEVDSKLSGKANTSHGNHVPTTQTANNATFLRNDNTWQKVTPANIGAAASSHTHKVENITDLTATATELNYMDGVTSNVQTQLNGKSATSHTHTADNLVQWADALFATSSNGGVEFSYGSNSGKNVLTEISNMSSGLHTIYSIAGTTGNPNTSESWRMLVHKTSVTIGWILAFDAQGSVYSNYQSAAGTFKGWKCIYDAAPPILWMGEYWCTDTQTVTPSKALSACRNGWVLVWSDYDTTNETASNGDCFTTVIPKWNPNHVKWSGQSFIAVVPTNLSDTGTVTFAGKRLYVHDTKITGNTVNDVSPSNDVCLRAIYEY